MENKEKYLRTNKRLKIGIIVFSVLSVVMLVGNKSYALFSNTVKTNNPVVTINTASEFPIKEPTASGLAKTILDKAYSNSSELVAIDVTDKSNIKKCESVAACKGKKKEYRYIGPSVNNYVYLNNNGANEKWRIIGLFPNDEETEWTVKVVRDSVLPESYLPTTYVINDAEINGEKKEVTYTIKTTSTTTSDKYKAYWNKNDVKGGNRWEESGIQYFLNTEKDSGSNRGFLSYLSADTKALLVEKTYYLGAVQTSNIPDASPKEAYLQERDVESCIDEKGPSTNNSREAIVASTGCRVWSGNAAKWKGKVALMYISDYGLSASETNWRKSFYGGYNSGSEDGFEDAAVNATTWMYSTMADSKSKNSWLFSPTTCASYDALYWNAKFGCDNCSGTATEYGVRPVLYLSSAAMFKSGSGTSGSPYVI